MSALSADLRIGIGYDVHAFAPGRRLVLGGVDIDHDMGLAGHSDADVLTHAVCDALLGALGLGDIGRHFPPDDPGYEGIDSLLLLRRVLDLVDQHGGRPWNIDATVIAERPRLQPSVDAMRSRLAECLEVEVDRVSVKATTHEGLGALGRGEGIAAMAVAAVRVRRSATQC